MYNKYYYLLVLFVNCLLVQMFCRPLLCCHGLVLVFSFVPFREEFVFIFLEFKVCRMDLLTFSPHFGTSFNLCISARFALCICLFHICGPSTGPSQSCLDFHWIFGPAELLVYWRMY